MVSVRESVCNTVSEFRKRCPVWWCTCQEMWVILALLHIVIPLSLYNPGFLSAQNISNIAENVSFTAVAALGMMMVMLTGGIDLSVGSVMALSAVVMSLVMDFLSNTGGVFSSWFVVVDGASVEANFPGLILGIAILVSLLSSALVGLINGFCITKLDIPPFVTTLGTLSIVRSFVYILTDGQGASAKGPDLEYLYLITSGWVFSLPLTILYLVGAMVFVYCLLYHKKLGRHILAVGGNERAAEMIGVPVVSIKIKAYVFCSVFAGIQGIIVAGWLGSAPPNMALGYELYVVAANVIGGVSLTGGMGGPVGPVFGCALLEIIRNGLVLANISAHWQQALAGAIIIIVVGFEKVRSRVS